jgi:hypothetical protein
MHIFRRLVLGISVAVLGSMLVATPAHADYWQYAGTYPTYEECDAAGTAELPWDADEYACSTWQAPAGSWNLYWIYGT